MFSSKESHDVHRSICVFLRREGIATNTIPHGLPTGRIAANHRERSGWLLKSHDFEERSVEQTTWSQIPQPLYDNRNSAACFPAVAFLGGCLLLLRVKHHLYHSRLVMCSGESWPMPELRLASRGAKRRFHGIQQRQVNFVCVSVCVLRS